MVENRLKTMLYFVMSNPDNHEHSLMSYAYTAILMHIYASMRIQKLLEIFTVFTFTKLKHHQF